VTRDSPNGISLYWPAPPQRGTAISVKWSRVCDCGYSPSYPTATSIPESPTDTR